MLAIVLGGLPERVHLHLASGRALLLGRRGRVREEVQVGQLTGTVKLPSGGVVEPLLEGSLHTSEGLAFRRGASVGGGALQGEHPGKPSQARETFRRKTTLCAIATE